MCDIISLSDYNGNDTREPPKPAALTNPSVDDEDGARLAKFAIEVMRRDGNPLAVVHALLPYVGEMPPPIVVSMHVLADQLMKAARPEDVWSISTD